MKYVALSSLALFGLTACSGPGGVTPSGGLMYGVPDAASVTYVTESSQNVGIDAGPMGTMNMTAKSEATLGFTFASGPGGVQVTTTFDKVSASMSQPMGAPLSATESDIEGDLVFTLDAKGRGTPVTVPSTKGAAAQLVSPISFVHEFFPRLPGGAVEPGVTWTDTIKWEAETDVGATSSNSVVTYTMVGDTVVAGKTLLHISYDGKAEVASDLNSGGMEIHQSSAGDVTGMFLWDPARGLMVSGESSQEMDGTVEVPAAEMPPMPITVTGSGTVRLQGG